MSRWANRPLMITWAAPGFPRSARMAGTVISPITTPSAPFTWPRTAAGSAPLCRRRRRLARRLNLTSTLRWPGFPMMSTWRGRRAIQRAPTAAPMTCSSGRRAWSWARTSGGWPRANPWWTCGAGGLMPGPTGFCWSATPRTRTISRCRRSTPTTAPGMCLCGTMPSTTTPTMSRTRWLSCSSPRPIRR